ncbi:MAG: signal peptidase II [bacterium]|nr:signal peptidase II [bacterium]
MTSQTKKQLVLVVSVFVAVLLIDQITKAIICHLIPVGSVNPGAHMGEFFWFTHERNPGLVGGMFRDMPYVAYVAPVLATGVLIYLFRHLESDSKIQSLAYGLVAGGAIGNLIDRFTRGEVVDFLQFHFHFIPFNFPWKYYPAFNAADSAICTGVFLLIVGWHWSQKAQGEADAADAA